MTASNPSFGAVEPPATELAVALVARVTGVAAEQWTVASDQRVVWSSSGLGLPARGQMELTVMTPGHRIVLTHGTRSVVVHTGRGTAGIFSDSVQVDPPSGQGLA